MLAFVSPFHLGPPHSRWLCGIGGDRGVWWHGDGDMAVVVVVVVWW